MLYINRNISIIYNITWFTQRGKTNVGDTVSSLIDSCHFGKATKDIFYWIGLRIFVKYNLLHQQKSQKKYI